MTWRLEVKISRFETCMRLLRQCVGILNGATLIIIEDDVEKSRKLLEIISQLLNMIDELEHEKTKLEEELDAEMMKNAYSEDQ